MKLDGNYIYFSYDEQKAADMPVSMDICLALTQGNLAAQTAEAWKQQAVEEKVQEIDWDKEIAFENPEAVRKYYDENMHHPDIYKRFAVGVKLMELAVFGPLGAPDIDKLNTDD